MIKLIRTSTIPLSLDIFCKGTLQKLQRHYEVIALSSPGTELDRVAQREGVRTIAIPMQRQIAICKDIVSLCRLVQVFKKERPIIVHSMTPKAGLLCMLAAWLVHVPIRIHTFTGLIWPTAIGFKRALLIATDRITIHCATHVIAEGKGVQQDLNTITHHPIDILGYGHICGVDLDYYCPAQRSWTTANQFLYVGRIVKDKGICELITAFTAYYKIDPSARLTIVGPIEQNHGLNESLINTLHSHPGIYYQGQQNDVRPYYQAANCLVFPSYREGFPNVILEASAMELPCIVTDVNGSREIVVNQHTGTIIPSHDSNALLNAMQQMALRPQMAHQMGQQARQRIAQYWEKSFVQHCLFDYYKNILCSIK